MSCFCFTVFDFKFFGEIVSLTSRNFQVITWLRIHLVQVCSSLVGKFPDLIDSIVFLFFFWWPFLDAQSQKRKGKISSKKKILSPNESFLKLSAS